jgi:hypothetical protein
MQHLVGSVEGFSRRVETWEMDLITATNNLNTAKTNVRNFVPRYWYYRGNKGITPESRREEINLERNQWIAQNYYNRALATANTKRAAERVRVKGLAESAYNTAVKAATAARSAWIDQVKEFDDEDKKISPLRTAYNNAKNAVDDARAKKILYDSAMEQQKTANTLLISASTSLSSTNTKTQEAINRTYTDDSAFMINAGLFPNTTFGTNNQYNVMSVDWTAYTVARTELAAIDSKNVVDSTTATTKLLEKYNKFNTSKGTYTTSVINALKSNTADRTYVENSKNQMEVYKIIYDITKEYNAMLAAWTSFTTSLNASPINVSDVITKYRAFIPTKTEYATVLLIAQDKKAEADFQTNVAAGKKEAAQWLTSGTSGCRNLQTIASTNKNMLDQNIACNNTEYLSGYNVVSGFNAAPTDPNVSRDNISQYLAVKYSCCVAPEGDKGPRGRKGLPGLGGAVGAIGPKGPEGVEGPSGPKGRIGDLGEEGGKGPAGDNGENGDVGEKGPPGRPGTSMMAPFIRQVPGPVGKTGRRGPAGLQGPKGKDGMVIPAPKQLPSALDKTIGLFNLQEKINNAEMDNIRF